MIVSSFCLTYSLDHRPPPSPKPVCLGKRWGKPLGACLVGLGGIKNKPAKQGVMKLKVKPRQSAIRSKIFQFGVCHGYISHNRVGNSDTFCVSQKKHCGKRLSQGSVASYL